MHAATTKPDLAALEAAWRAAETRDDEARAALADATRAKSPDLRSIRAKAGAAARAAKTAWNAYKAAKDG